MLRLAGAQIAGWKARLTVVDLDVAGDLLSAIAPLGALAQEVAHGRRQLAMAHATALEQRLVGAASFRGDGAPEHETYAVVARLRKLAGLQRTPDPAPAHER